MNLRLTLRCTALALSLVLLLPSAALAADNFHADVDFPQMVFDTPYNESQLDDILGQITSLSRHPQATDQGKAALHTLYAQMEQTMKELSTRSALSNIRYDQNQSDPAAAQQSAQFSDLSRQAYNDCYSALQLITASPYADELETLVGADNAKFLAHFSSLSAQELELNRRETELTQQYDQALQQTYTYNGREWSEAQLQADDTLSPEAHAEIRKGLLQKQNKAAGEVFVQLVKLRTEMAQLRGYDNYADYAYAEIYARDYKYRNVKNLYADVKNYLLPVEITLGSRKKDAADFPSLSGEEILDAMQPHMGQIAPELAESFGYLRQHQLYDIDPAPNKYPGGYTINLPYYGAAFVFNSPNGTVQDYATMVHEFGHFNAAYYSTESPLWSSDNLDVAETQSQGLELLFLDYADQALGEAYGDSFRDFAVHNILTSVSDGCMYDEFQQKVYRHPDMTLDEINRMFFDISQKYGYVYQSPEDAYHWVLVPHTFHSPMYYISYATSALAALELYQLSLTDRPAAVQAYLDISKTPSTTPFRDMLNECGLKDVFGWNAVSQLAYDLDNTLLDGKTLKGDSPSLLHKLRHAFSVSDLIFFLTIIAICLHLWRRKKS